MSFPDISKFPDGYPGPYERNMGESIVRLLELFEPYIPDKESNKHVTQLARNVEKWSAGHAVFREIRGRFLTAQKNHPGSIVLDQYVFEELCCQAIYIASHPDDPFDESSPFFVVPAALVLANNLNVPMSEISKATNDF